MSKNTSERAFETIIGLSAILPYSFLSLGNGRYLTNPNLEDFANKEGIPIYRLEDETNGGLRELNLLQRSAISSIFIMGTAVAPAFYYIKIAEAATGRLSKSGTTHVTGELASVSTRDAQMSEKIVYYLNVLPPSRILVTVGKGHLDGIVGNLRTKVNLVPSNTETAASFYFRR